VANFQSIRKGALIGCGFFSKNHLHAWRQLDGVEIIALCDSDPLRLQQAAQEFGISKTYASAQALFAAERLDFVDIATTVNSHRALVELAAQHRVACICQKPLANSMEDAQAMVKACDDALIPLMIHENFRWQTPIQAVKTVLDQGTIGKPFWGRVSFRSAFDVFAGQPYLATGARFILQDLGIHIIDIARFLFGEAKTLSASTHRVNPNIRGEDVATLLMQHDEGMTSVVDCSYATRLEEELFPQTLIEVDGAEGSIRLGANYVLTVVRNGQPAVHKDCAPPLHDWAQRPWHAIQDSVLNIQHHWLECLNGSSTPQTSGHDNLKTMQLLELAYASAAQQQRALHCQPGSL
jgi:predicted dehydrogenase